MTHIYCKNLDDVWFAISIEKEKVIATSFAPSEIDALRLLLRSLPHKVPFKMVEKQLSSPTRFCQH